MKDFTASRIYFQGVIDLYYDTQWAAKSSFMIAESYRKTRQIEEAIEGYRIFLQKYPDHEWSTRAKVAIDDMIAQRSVSEKSE